MKLKLILIIGKGKIGNVVVFDFSLFCQIRKKIEINWIVLFLTEVNSWIA